MDNMEEGTSHVRPGDYDPQQMRELEAVRQAAAAREPVAAAVRAALDAGLSVEQIERAEKAGEADADVLEQVARCASRASDSQQDFRDAVVAAADAGIPMRRIATAAGYSHQWIQRLVKAGRS